MPTLDQLDNFRTRASHISNCDRNGPVLQGLDESSFIGIYALKYKVLLQYQLKLAFENSGHDIEGYLNDQLQNLAQQNSQSVYKVGDMIDAKITVKDPNDLLNAFKKIKECGVQVIKIQNDLDCSMKNVTINGIFDNAILCEIELALDKNPPNIYAHNLLHNLSKAECIFRFKQLILQELNSLQDNDRITLPPIPLGAVKIAL